MKTIEVCPDCYTPLRMENIFEAEQYVIGPVPCPACQRKRDCECDCEDCQKKNPLRPSRVPGG